MEITELLERAGKGDHDAERQLIPLVYSELKRLAAGHLKGSWNLTLGATALVHEAFLRFAAPGGLPARFEDRSHFFGIASRVMRNVVVDAVRVANAQKRGPGLTVYLEDIGEIAASRENLLLDLDAALDRLEGRHPRCAKIVEMRYFAGLSLEEVAGALSISISTAQRDLRFAQAWLHRELSGGRQASPSAS